jgi:hypothetical protein
MSKLYPLILDDAGKNMSRRPLQVGDCTVRALAVATKVKYDTCYEALKAAGRKSHDGFNLGAYLKTMGLFYGWRASLVRMPKMTLAKFFGLAPKGRYIIETSDHVIAVIARLTI